MLGLFSFPAPVGVGSHDPDAVSTVRGANVASSQHVPSRIVPERGQVTEHDIESAISEIWAVLHESVDRSNFANDASELRPEPGALASEAESAAGARDVLAGEAAADDVDMPAPGPPVEGADVVPDGEALEHAVPLPREQHAPAVGINLDSADGAPSKEEPSQDAASCPCKKCQLTHHSPPRFAP
jgi:hypothetical protein